MAGKENLANPAAGDEDDDEVTRLPFFFIKTCVSRSGLNRFLRKEVGISVVEFAWI